jgi:hypothetical protein
MIRKKETSLRLVRQRAAPGHLRRFESASATSAVPQKLTFACVAISDAAGQFRTHAVQQELFDHLVGTAEDRLRNSKTERLGGLEVDG